MKWPITINVSGRHIPDTVEWNRSDTGEVTEDVSVDLKATTDDLWNTPPFTDIGLADVAAFLNQTAFNPDGSTNITRWVCWPQPTMANGLYVVDNVITNDWSDDRFVTGFTVTAIDAEPQVSDHLPSRFCWPIWNHQTQVRTGIRIKRWPKTWANGAWNERTHDVGYARYADVDTSDMPAFKLMIVLS